MEKQQPAKDTPIAFVICLIAIISSWLSFLLHFITLGLLIWIGSLVYLFIKRKTYIFSLLMISSWTMLPLAGFFQGSEDYFRGKATLKTTGFPDREFHNLDPDLRVWNSTSGCMVRGTEIFIQSPGNAAVRFWTFLLGPQKGVYKGIYPTKEQAKDLVAKGEPITLSKQADGFYFQYKKEILALRSNSYADKELLEKTTEGKAFVLNDECLLMETSTDSTLNVIFLADKDNGNVFATFYFDR